MAVTVPLLLTSVSFSAFATEEDSRIEASFQKSYVFKTYLKDEAITIDSSDGVVILKGSVAQEPNKSLAEETVASLPGVKSVDNRIKVKKEGSSLNSDAWLTMKVKTALLFHRSVSAMTEVNTKNGIVVLQGEAENEAQKDLTTEYVKDVEGVKEVKNEMIVQSESLKSGEKTIGGKIDTMGESIDDASVTALVKMTLLYHRSTSALHTKVTTNKGLVTLKGSVKNAAEKNLVTKYVEDVRGVESVVNKMTIEKTIAER